MQHRSDSEALLQALCYQGLYMKVGLRGKKGFEFPGTHKSRWKLLLENENHQTYIRVGNEALNADFH